MTCLLASIRFPHMTELVSGIADNRNMREVAQSLSTEMASYLDESTAPVGPHTADQLLLPLALTSGGQFHATELTEHFLTNIRTIEAFFGKGYIEWEKVEREGVGAEVVAVVPSSAEAGDGKERLSSAASFTASSLASSAAPSAAVSTSPLTAERPVAVQAIGAPCRLGYKVKVRPFPTA